MILNFAQQKQLLDQANGKGSGQKPVTIIVENNGNDEAVVERTETDREEIIRIAVGRSVEAINNNIRTGQGETERSLQERDRRTG